MGVRCCSIQIKMAYGQNQTRPVQPDASYGQHCIQADANPEELNKICQDYVSRQQTIAIRTVRQSDDPSGEFTMERHGRLTAFHLSEVFKKKIKQYNHSFYVSMYYLQLVLFDASTIFTAKVSSQEKATVGKI